jgi:hypothetical protein
MLEYMRLGDTVVLISSELIERSVDKVDTRE